MEDQLKLYDEAVKDREKIQKELPALMTGQDAVKEAVYKDGALSHKVKKLIALGIALRAGCGLCIIGQAKQAIDAGATKDEVLEATSVAVAMGGSTALAESPRVLKVLEELGKM